MEENHNIEQEQIRNSGEYIAELEEIVHHDKELRKIVGHEIGNILNLINCSSELLKEGLNSLPVEEKLKNPLIEYCEIIKRNVKKQESIATLLHLNSLKHADLKSASEQFDLEEMIRKNILSLESNFKKNNLGVNYSYNKTNELPISVYTHKGFINAIINTILFNLIKHAPKESLSRVGLSVQNESLEIICENLIGESRQEYGSNTGVGFYLLNLAKKQMKGNLEIEISKIDREYQHKEIIGYEYAKELENHDIFSLRFYIPMKELISHPSKK